jgi:hypothetical protein
MSHVSPKPERPDDDTLRLAVQLADEVFSSPALADGQRFQIHIHLTPGEHSVSFTEPERRELRDLLGLIRKFDMPTHDVRMRRLYEIVERVGVKPDWREGLEQAQAAYEARNELTGIQVQVPDEPSAESPTWIRPREAFELWACGEVIHDDYPKVLRWQKLGPPGQGLVRQMAYDYLAILLEQAAFIRRVITHGLDWSCPGFVDGEPLGAPGDLPG